MLEARFDKKNIQNYSVCHTKIIISDDMYQAERPLMMGDLRKRLFRAAAAPKNTRAQKLTPLLLK